MTIWTTGAAGTPTSAPAGQPPVQVTPQDAAKTLGRVDPQAVAPSVPDVVGGYTISDPSLSGSLRSGFKIVGSYVEGVLANDSRAGARLNVGSSSVAIAPVGIANSATPATKVAGGDAVIYANTEPDVDLLVRPTDKGIESFTQIRSSGAPESYSWTFKRSEGGDLEATGNGGAVFRDPSGTALLDILPVSARDAAGASIPTSLTVSANAITVTVSHRAPGTVYPVVADPEVVVASSDLQGIWESFLHGSKCVLAVADPRACNTARVVGDWARAESQEHFRGRTGEGGVGDAYRHCPWSGFMAWRLGPGKANAIAKVHENLMVNQPRGRKMDMHNNAVGRRYAAPYVGSSNHSAADNKGVRWPCMNSGIRSRQHQLVWFGAGV